VSFHTRQEGSISQIRVNGTGTTCKTKKTTTYEKKTSVQFVFRLTQFPQ
jgi:hypothetical protein